MYRRTIGIHTGIQVRHTILFVISPNPSCLFSRIYEILFTLLSSNTDHQYLFRGQGRCVSLVYTCDI